MQGYYWGRYRTWTSDAFLVVNKQTMKSAGVGSVIKTGRSEVRLQEMYGRCCRSTEISCLGFRTLRTEQTDFLILLMAVPQTNLTHSPAILLHLHSFLFSSFQIPSPLYHKSVISYITYCSKSEKKFRFACSILNAEKYRRIKRANFSLSWR